MTVVKPPRAVPAIFCTRAMTPSTTEVSRVITPKTVTRCSGMAVKAVILETAYFIRDQVDHLDSPAVRSRTS